jgi:hypothetical protein
MAQNVSKLTEGSRSSYPYAQEGAPFPKDEGITLAGVLLVAQAWTDRHTKRPRRVPFSGAVMAQPDLERLVKDELLGWQRQEAGLEDTRGRRAARGQSSASNAGPGDQGAE